MKVLLLVNSSASSVTARSRVVIQKALSADHEVTLAETSRRGHATRLAQGAAAAGTEVVVVLGGDGTLNEAANGLAGSDVRAGAAAGRVDQRVRPHDRAAERPDRGDGRPPGRTGPRAGSSASVSASVNGRYFLFHVGMGFDAAVVAQVERRSGLKRYAGHPLFVYAGFDTALRHYDRSRPRFSVRFQDGSVVDDGYLSHLPQHQPLHLPRQPTARPGSGGHPRPGPRLGHRADPRLHSHDAHHRRPRSTNGRHLRTSRWTDHRTDLTELTVTGYGPFPYQVDGDYLGDTEHLVLRHEPAVLDLVMPVVVAPSGQAPRARWLGRW